MVETKTASRRFVGGRRVTISVALLLSIVAAGSVVSLSGHGSKGSGPTPSPSAQDMAPLPDPLVPESLGNIKLRREPRAERAFASAGGSSLVAAGRVYSLNIGNSVEASLQAVVIHPNVAARGEEVVDQVLRSLGGGGFIPTRFGRARGYELALPEQRLLLWFSPNFRAYELLVARSSFADAEVTFARLIAFQHDYSLDGPEVPVPDPRRSLS